MQEIRGSIPRGPISLYWSCVLSLGSCLFTSEIPQALLMVSGLELEQSGCGGVWALQKPNYKPTRNEIKNLWPEAKQILDDIGRFLPKQRLIHAIELLSDARKRRFLRRRLPKYGSMNKGFVEEELVRFLNAVEEPKITLLFTYQAVLGLRIGETVKLNVKDINLKTRELRIDNSKGDRIDYLPIPPQLFEQTLKFISDYEDEIVKRKGHLFWADHYPERNPCPHVATDYVRKVFRQAVRKAKLDETYGLAEGKTPKLLHRLTTHSLRHYAVTNFSQKNNGNVVLTSRFARHQRLETTMIYIHTEKDELYKSIALAQEDGILDKVRRMQNTI